MSIEWANSLEKLKPYVFKIRTPRGSGTGFQISFSEKNNFCGIATALHVIEHAYEWEEPIKLTHYVSGETLILHKDERVIYTYSNKDLAFILFHKKQLPLQTETLEIIEENKRIKQGVLMGWCGFPAIAPNDLCFFSGHNSSWLENEESYLVDGVAINGVSGGPAFTPAGGNPKLCGIVSAYIPNRATGESLPGVCVIRDVAPYQHLLKSISSLDEAEKEKEKIETIEPENGKSKNQKQIEEPQKPIRKKKSSTPKKQSRRTRKSNDKN